MQKLNLLKLNADLMLSHPAPQSFSLHSPETLREFILMEVQHVCCSPYTVWQRLME